ncbi:DUF4199 domain-containing protein [Mucilaginibacter sp. PAMB04168]|uniref:DUF4199 domain-containing protein n=1 Tax=Mucilaginibacter sp. PAMB04168 TaxID=3138567 RepID=UPI0031F6B32C
MKKNIWIFGLFSGLIVAIFMVVSTALCYNDPNFESSMLVGYAGMLLAFSFVFVGIKNYRDKFNNGAVSFVQALKIGGLIMLIASTFYVVVWLFDYYLFVPDFMDRYTAHVITQAKAEGDSPAEISKQVAELANYKEMYSSPIGVILLTYMEILPVGIIVTLISALILKRKSNAGETAIAA